LTGTKAQETLDRAGITIHKRGAVQTMINRAYVTSGIRVACRPSPREAATRAAHGNGSDYIDDVLMHIDDEAAST
jgi:glycine/serine hydroxymethyltransferase